ncbi:MAG: transposase [Campylobacterales bacterium]|nr:transposase [Campylobacterales bacterium]
MTKLANILNRAGYSHDIFTKLLRKEIDIEQELRLRIKPMLEKSYDGILILDDFLIKKPYTKESELNSYYYDNSEKRIIRGINVINFLYVDKNRDNMQIPVAFKPMIKDEIYEENGKEKRKSSLTKNEVARDIVGKLIVEQKLKVSHIVGDSWFASNENMEYFGNKLGQNFLFAVKSNRNIAFKKDDKINGKFLKIKDSGIKAGESHQVYLKGYNHPLRLIGLYVKNGMNSNSVKKYLITNDLENSVEALIEIYQKRWKVEEFHKTLKQNLNIEKSPTKVTTTQVNHIFFSMLAFIELEKLRVGLNKNHYSIIQSLYINATKQAFSELYSLKKQVLSISS